MSRATPRQGRSHKRQSSNLIPAVSDYESDVAAAAAAAAAASASASAAAATAGAGTTTAPTSQYAPPPLRTNTEINLSVLRRYVPSIRAILSIAANAVVYTFADESWDKSGVEGTLFVCTQESSSSSSSSPPDGTTPPRACVFVLNRRGLGNVIVDLAHVSDVEVAAELLILRVQDGGERVLGFWMHNDTAMTRQVNVAMIQECWALVRAAGAADHQRQDAGPAMQAIGRPLTMNELFGSQAVTQGH